MGRQSLNWGEKKLAVEFSGRRFLMDTGNSFSIFPHQSWDPSSGPSLRSPGREEDVGGFLWPPFHVDLSVG